MVVRCRKIDKEMVYHRFGEIYNFEMAESNLDSTESNWPRTNSNKNGNIHSRPFYGNHNYTKSKKKYR